MKYLSRIPIIGIIRGADTGMVEGAAAAAFNGGFRTLEITLNRPEAYDQIAMLRAKYAGEMELGAGTVLDADSAAKAVAAGAEFMVTPALLPDVIEYCRGRSVPVFPGAMTPTEVLAAHRAGAEMVKVFPASSLGPGYIKSLKGPFPEIRLMPTGGVTVESISEYLRAGADGFGIGGELFRREWMERKEWGAIERKAGEYIQALKGAQ